MNDQLLSPFHRNLKNLRVQPALRWIEGPVTNVAHVHLSEHWVSLSHSAQYGECGTVAAESQAQPPPGGQAKTECNAREDGTQNQFTISAHELVRTIERLVNNN